MAKSSMSSASIRKHHRRIQHQTRVDNHTRQERMYKQKEHHPMITTLHLTTILTTLQKISGWVGNLVPFRWLEEMMSGGSGISNLDLTIDSPFDTDRKRDAGAHYLRSMWPGLGTMVSTRDGKVIK